MTIGRVVASFVKANNGGVCAVIDGKVCFPDHNQDQTAQVGETWEAIVVGENPKGTVNFLVLVRKINNPHTRNKTDRLREDRSRRQQESARA